MTTVFGRDAYRQHDQNWDIVQAENGPMMVANGHGLMEWDGERWRMYPTPDRTRLRSIARWTDGRIYTGTLNEIGYFQPDPDKGRVYRSLIADWPSERRNFGEVWSVAATSRWVVFVTVDQLFVYDGNSVRTVPGIQPGTYRVFSVSDRVFIKQQTSPNLLELVADSDLRMRVVSSHLPQDAFPMAVYETVEGWLVVTAVHGVLRVTVEEAEVVVPPDAFGDEVVLFSSFIDNDGYHYLGSLKHGLFVLNPQGELVRNYRQSHGLGANTVLSITADSQGSLWLAGAPAITRMLPPRKLSRLVTDDDTLSLEFVIRHGGRIYLCGFGFYVLEPDDNPLYPPRFQSIEGMSNNQIWDAESVGDDLLLATNDGVVRVRMSDGGEVIDREVVARSEFAFDIDGNEAQNEFFAAAQDGLFRLERTDDGAWRSIRISEVDRAQRRVLRENDSTVWVAGDDPRLLRVTDIDKTTGTATIERFDASSGIGDRSPRPMRYGDLTVFVGSRGLLQYDGQAFVFWEPGKAFSHLRGRSVSPLFKDAQGRIWTAVDGDPLLAMEVNGKWVVDSTLFDILPDHQIQSVFDPDPSQDPRRVWLVSEESGVLSVDLALSQKNAPQLPVLIRSVEKLDSDGIYYQGEEPLAIPILDQQSNSIRIHYAAPDFLADGSSEYRVRLLGSGASAWSGWTRESRKDYTLLAGGDYRFEVQARTRSGAKTKAAGFAFSVEPHWYLQPRMKMLYVFLGLFSLALSVVAGSKWRKRKTRAMQRQLRQLVSERTAALARANRQLEVLANSDGLTGLANRRHLDARLEEMVEDRQQAGVILIDVDYFKQFNDTHGHLAGDDLLRALAAVLTGYPSLKEALCARFGGEEFVVLLPGAEAERIVEIAEGLRKDVERSLDITVSLGVAVRRLDDEADIQRLLSGADRALYDAKQNGRNRVVSLAS